MVSKNEKHSPPKDDSVETVVIKAASTNIPGKKMEFSQEEIDRANKNLEEINKDNKGRQLRLADPDVGVAKELLEKKVKIYRPVVEDGIEDLKEQVVTILLDHEDPALNRLKIGNNIFTRDTFQYFADNFDEIAETGRDGEDIED